MNTEKLALLPTIIPSLLAIVRLPSIAPFLSDLTNFVESNSPSTASNNFIAISAGALMLLLLTNVLKLKPGSSDSFANVNPGIACNGSKEFLLKIATLVSATYIDATI